MKIIFHLILLFIFSLNLLFIMFIIQILFIIILSFIFILNFFQTIPNISHQRFDFLQSIHLYISKIIIFHQTINLYDFLLIKIFENPTIEFNWIFLKVHQKILYFILSAYFVLIYTNLYPNSIMLDLQLKILFVFIIFNSKHHNLYHFLIKKIYC